MANNEEENYQDEVISEEQLSHEDILEEYRRRKMLEHMIGPVVSLVLHVVVLIACALFLVGKDAEDTSEFEFSTQEEEVKEIEPEQEEIEEPEEMEDQQEVPEVERPDVQPDEAEEAPDDMSDEMASTETDVNIDSAIETSSSSPLTLSGVFGSRGEEGRQEALDKYAGKAGDATESAVLKALRWLKRKQKDNGSWSDNNTEAMTGLALLTFLAHGETPQESEEFGETVRKGIQWLIKQLDDKSGVSGKHGPAYTHGIATYAICEAYGLTQLPPIKAVMEKSLQTLIEGQQDKGGWDYGYSQGERWDLSVAGWQLQALKAGKAAGADVEGLDEAIEKGIKYLKEIAYQNGKFHYSGEYSDDKIRDPYPAMQGIGVLSLQLHGEGESDQVEEVLERIEDIPIRWDSNAPRWPLYTWYYSTQAMFHGGQRTFKPWNKKFAPMLVENQADEGYWEAPPDTEEAGRDDTNRYYSTTLAALSLQVYYRYLPTYQSPDESEEDEDAMDMGDEEDLGLDID